VIDEKFYRQSQVQAKIFQLVEQVEHLVEQGLSHLLAIIQLFQLFQLFHHVFHCARFCVWAVVWCRILHKCNGIESYIGVV
jgi:hypothetical protein